MIKRMSKCRISLPMTQLAFPPMIYPRHKRCRCLHREVYLSGEVSPPPRVVSRSCAVALRAVRPFAWLCVHT